MTRPTPEPLRRPSTLATLAAAASLIASAQCGPAPDAAAPTARTSSAGPAERGAGDADVWRVLDDWHAAAAAADEARYFAHFAPYGVFLGTGAAARRTVPARRAFP